jgi:type VI secretion system secreted protein VgrG
MAKLAIHQEHYRFEPSDGSLPEFNVVEFSGQEGISQLMHFDLELECDAEDHDKVDFSKILDKPATLIIRCWPDFTEERTYHGIIASFEQTAQTDDWVTFYAVLVPRLWHLTLNYQSRIFQEMSAPEIVEDVLKNDAQFQSDDYRLSLQGTYDKLNQPPREFCVQYQESDFAFISRLMEEAGMFYFFEYTDSKEVMVIADAPSVHQETSPISQVRFADSSGLIPPEEEVVTAIRYKESVLTGKVSLKDFNYDTPQTNLLVESQINSDAPMEIYHYPGRYGFVSQGNNFARIRNEEIEASRKLISGSSDCRSFCTGYLFNLVGHPHDYLNAEYLLTHVSHFGAQGGRLAQDVPTSYENHFECIPADVSYRPSRKTPKPMIQGAQTATVVGPAGEEIYVDGKGRVKLQFHWDRQGKKDENSSCWIRVSQLWAGANWGAMFIPRIGQEVIVSFLECDPDQPIITGRVYNGDNVVPYGLPGEKTKSTIKSNSSMGGGGSNELRFEDLAGSEEIYLHGQKDWTIAIENDKNQTVGHDETLNVGNDRTKSVGNDQSESIGHDKTIDVKNDHNETIGNNMTLSVGSNRDKTVGSNQSEKIGANKTITVGGNHTEAITGNMSQTVSSAKTETITLAKALSIGAAYQVSVGGAMNETVGAAKMEEIVGAKIVSVGAVSSEDVGLNKSVNAGGNISESASKNSNYKAGQDFAVQSGQKMTLSAGNDFSVAGQAKGVIDIKNELVLKCGSASITLKSSGDIEISGANIKVNGRKITQEGQQEVKISAMNITSEAKVGNKIKGSMTNLEASGINTIKGSLVKIN